MGIYNSELHLLDSVNTNIQWYLNDALIVPFPSLYINIPKQNGNYKVVASDSLGCYQQSSKNISLIFDAISENSIGSFSLSPIPTKGIITVSGETLKNTTVFVYNWLGILLETKQSFGEKLLFDLTDYPAGIYTVVVRNDKGLWTGAVVRE